MASEIIIPDDEFTHIWRSQAGGIQEDMRAVQAAFPIYILLQRYEILLMVGLVKSIHSNM